MALDFFSDPLLLLDEPNRLKDSLDEWGRDMPWNSAKAEISGEAFSMQEKLLWDWSGFTAALPRERLLSFAGPYAR